MPTAARFLFWWDIILQGAMQPFTPPMPPPHTGNLEWPGMVLIRWPGFLDIEWPGI